MALETSAMWFFYHDQTNLMPFAALLCCLFGGFKFFYFVLNVSKTNHTVLQGWGHPPGCGRLFKTET